MKVKREETIEPGTVYIAPAGLHMTVSRVGTQYRIQLSKSPTGTLHTPSVDVLMHSVARVYGGHGSDSDRDGLGRRAGDESYSGRRRVDDRPGCRKLRRLRNAPFRGGNGRAQPGCSLVSHCRRNHDSRGTAIERCGGGFHSSWLTISNFPIFAPEISVAAAESPADRGEFCGSQAARASGTSSPDRRRKFFLATRAVSRAPPHRGVRA